MQSLKSIRRRIQSVKNTQKVTKAMKLVAAAKLRRAQRNALSARPYTDGLRGIIKRIVGRVGSEAPPLMERRKKIKNLDVLVITSDRGLCGGFNENLLLAILNGIEQHTPHDINVTLFVVGRKGWQYLKPRYSKIERLLILEGESEKEFAKRTANLLTNRYLSQESDGTFVALNRFESAARQEVSFWDFLPLHWNSKEKDHLLDYLYEPERDEIRDELMRQSLARSIEQAFLESRASELAARMLAMDNATKNADEMISHLTHEYHKARQAAITSELLDIVGGAEALR